MQTSPQGASAHAKRKTREDGSEAAAKLSHDERVTLPSGYAQRCAGCIIGVKQVEDNFKITTWDAKARKKMTNNSKKGCAGCGHVPLCGDCWKHWDHKGAAGQCKPERDFRVQCGVSATI
jgi:sulfatase maturation enzyme AslB (radical SAM superfamily)